MYTMFIGALFTVAKCVDKHNVVNMYNKILFSHKKELNSDTFCNMEKPWKYSANKGKLDTEGAYCMSPLVCSH